MTPETKEMDVEHTAGRNSIEFPLGLVLLLAWVLFMCAFFCFCSNWDELRSLSRSSPSSSSDTQIQAVEARQPPQKPTTPSVMIKQDQAESLSVLMPGDELPKFIALACPCQLSMDEKIAVQMQKLAVSNVCSGN
ncbi:hypothetical protein L6164_024063 [Bauhinia variegata]|uniref:Uncharacterized protein n=1 Tax=Bauhinia variegata TaxID=167791 RepID=A0ACB9LXK0_BAUVA|nr:hypothetical protein L6164_024063 [Bauhinia variegata]